MNQTHQRESLFEKLAGQYADGTPLSAVPRDQRRVKSVCDHLSKLLNTRQGTLSHMPDYGLPDIAQVYRGLPGSLDEFSKTVIKTVNKYEPRLERVRVEAAPFNPLDMRIVFQITAWVRGGGRIYLNTAFASSGQASVQEARRKP